MLLNYPQNRFIEGSLRIKYRHVKMMLNINNLTILEIIDLINYYK